MNTAMKHIKLFEEFEESVNENTFKVDKMLKVIKNLIEKGYLQPWQIDDDKILDIAAREKVLLNVNDVDAISSELDKEYN